MYRMRYLQSGLSRREHSGQRRESRSRQILSGMRVPYQYLDFQSIWVNWHQVYRKNQRDLLFHGAPNALLIVSRKCNEVDGCFNAGHLELLVRGGSIAAGFGVIKSYIDILKESLIWMPSISFTGL